MLKKTDLLLLLAMLGFFHFDCLPGNRCLAQVQDDALPYLNPKLPVAARVADLLGRMSLEEKVGQMGQYVAHRYLASHGKKKPSRDRHLDQRIVEGAVGSLIFVVDPNEANAYQKLAEKSRLKIPLLFCIDAVHGLCPVRGATVLPSPIGLASSFNTELVKRVQQVTAKEMRAIGIGWALHPMLGIAREPRWGRTAELFGEDPYLTTEMARAVIRGFQGKDFSSPDNVVACAKTFLAHSVPMGGRNYAATDVSERTLRSVFMPPYQAAVEEGVFSLMPAYHELNGIPCHGSKALLTDLLRGEWGFSGFIVSDWGGVEMLQKLHHTASTHAEAVQQAVLAGVDIHMAGGGFGKTLVQLVKEGVISEKRIDQSVARLLTAKFQLGHFENRTVDPKRGAQVLFCDEHRSVALQSAIQSMVLLENKNRLLPLDKSIRSILVTGPNADNTAILGDWTTVQPEANYVTVLEGIREKVSPATKVTYEDVGKNWEITDETIARVVQAAKQVDVALVVVGGNHTRWNERGEFDRHRKERTGGEGTDRADLKLVGKQLELVQEIHATGTPTVVVLVNGRSLAIPWIAKNIPAVLEAWEPGSEGGHAVADLLFGDANPSGKLAISFPVSVGQLAVYYNHPPSAEKDYQASDSKPVYSFGYGLSYTSFELSNLVVPERVAAGEPILVSVDVQNRGEQAGDEIVLLYVHDVVSSVVTPVKELKGFQRVSLLPGEKKSVRFRIPLDSLALYSREMKKVVEPGAFEIMVGDLKKEIVVE